MAKLFSAATHAATVKLTFDVTCTPQGCIKLLDHINDGQGIDIEGKNAVVCGRFILIGMLDVMLPLYRNATITIVHSQTKSLKA
jgi:methylenetetrahydrofolate dehydrogenase (NADP+)/methenyltetrahydrofolate cyclohydrolase